MLCRKVSRQFGAIDHQVSEQLTKCRFFLKHSPVLCALVFLPKAPANHLAQLPRYGPRLQVSWITSIAMIANNLQNHLYSGLTVLLAGWHLYYATKIFNHVYASWSSAYAGLYTLEKPKGVRSLFETVLQAQIEQADCNTPLIVETLEQSFSSKSKREKAHY